jgi:toxin ParE1/3/4
MPLRVSAEAGADLDAIRLYGFEHYGDRAADAYLAALTRSFDRIAEWPLAARLRTEIQPPVRLVAHQAHNIFYDVDGDIVEIVRVLHHSMDWQNEL